MIIKFDFMKTSVQTLEENLRKAKSIRPKSKKVLMLKNFSAKGRNNRGVITSRHRGGGNKKKYRLIDFRRNTHTIPARVMSIDYDPNRNVKIALLYYKSGEKKYILCPRLLKLGSIIYSGINVPLEIGNSLPLSSIPLGMLVHNIEITPGRGGQIARAAGTCAQIIAKEGNYVTLRMPSSEVRLINKNCYATIGQLGNFNFNLLSIGKAGRSRWLGRRPKVRGSAMNPVDHPHGGGEGRCPIGRSRPLTPWGKPALGIKTRKNNKYSNSLIIRSRKR